jgi:hypothetical protein
MNPPPPPPASAQQRARLVWLVMALLGAIGGGLAAAWLSFGITPRSPTGDGGTPNGQDLVADGPPWFRDLTGPSSLQFTYRNGEEADHYSILESVGGGIGLIDFDNDGLLDVFIAGGGYFDGPDKKIIEGHPCKLFRNLGAWKFADVSASVGLARSWFYSHGVAVADYDRDGWADLLVTGYGGLALLHNEADGRGGRRFVDGAARLGLQDQRPLHWSTSAGWADLDGDGYPDLYVCHYVNWSFANHPVCQTGAGGAPDICQPHRFQSLPHMLLRNDQGRAFRALASNGGRPPLGNGLGVVLVDVNDDARPDIYVANDATDNLLFLNRGGKLEEKALVTNVAVDDTGRATASMGVDAGDYDGSGRPALWVTTFAGELHSLFRNLGCEQFHHLSRAAGVNSIGMHLVGFGTNFVDIDNDGWEDLIIANGHVYRRPGQGSTPRQPARLLRNVAAGERRVFKNASAQGGSYFESAAIGRGLAVGDLDNDGWPDVVICNTNDPVAVLRNVAAEAAPGNWLGVKLAGRERRDVVGSTVIVEGAGTKLTRFAKGGSSYLSAGDPRIVFGLGGSSQPCRVTVRWSWGAVQSWDNLAPGAYWELREGEAAARRLQAAP